MPCPSLRNRVMPLRKIVWRVTLCGITLVVLLAILGIGWSCQIRLDCGDLRFCFLGVPVQFESMREPERAALIRVSQQSVNAGPDWVWCATEVGSNRPHRMCNRFYREAAAWAEIDPAISRFMLEDIAEYIRRTHGQRDLPACIVLRSVIDVGSKDTARLVVSSVWKKDPAVVEYLRERGYDIRLAREE